MRLIVGVDPGTTVGYAVLNLDGKVVELGSRKEFSLDMLVAKVAKLGAVVLVGCDKAKVPSFVQDFAVKFRVKVVSPRVDVQVSEKRSLAQGFEYSNSHEMDALSSALIALKRVQPLLRKIRVALADNKKEEFFEDVVDLVVREGISIHAALTILNPVVEEDTHGGLEETARDSDIVHLYSALKNARREISALKKKNSVLVSGLDQASHRLYKLEHKCGGLVRPKALKQLSAEKEKRIHVLSAKLERLDSELDSFKKSVLDLEKWILLEGFVAVPRIARFSGNEVPVSDVVYVDDPNEFSEKFVRSMNASVVVFSMAPSRNVRQRLPFVFVDGAGIAGRLFDCVAFVDRKKLERARSSKDALAKVITEYRKSRVV